MKRCPTCRRPFIESEETCALDDSRLVIEAGATGGWWRYVGARGDVIGLDRFGHSAPAKPLFEHFGFTVDAVVTAAKRLL